MAEENEEKQPDSDLAAILENVAETSEEEITRPEETTQEETQDEEKTEESPEKPEDKSEALESDEPVVSDEMAEKHPWMKNFIGKPLDDAFAAYENVQRAYSRSQQMLVDVQKRQQTQPAKEEKEEKLEDLDIDLLGPEERTKLLTWLDKRDAIREKRREQKMLEMLQPAFQVSTEQTKGNILSAIQSEIPQTAKADDVLAAFVENNQGMLTPDVVEFYDRHLDLFTKEVANWFNGSHYKQELEKASKRTNADAAKKAAEKLRQAEKIKTQVRPGRKAGTEQVDGDPDLRSILDTETKRNQAREG